MSLIAPIETHYAGCRFRSRLEARWAVFFDSLEIPWLYEHEGYRLDGIGRYLPDFLLYPDTSKAIWFEVKAGVPNNNEIRKSQTLSSATGVPAFIYYAYPDLPAPAALMTMSGDEFTQREMVHTWGNKQGWSSKPVGPLRWQTDLTPTAFAFSPTDEGEPRSSFRWWTECDRCGLVILKNHGQVGQCPQREEDLTADRALRPSFGHATPRLHQAYCAARSARFEFGEGLQRAAPIQRSANRPVQSPSTPSGHDRALPGHPREHLNAG
ncbi:hypothetical protein E1263_38375 [Kribbella antibiotica]|uniref:Uncharacterized protein n=1 Tax=Kribbella antibiotica TaxID=190195 RepID=A0A4R4YKY3_9ACTN|nr:hypothetical protein [Kribbella antibiotica]TDD45556.1 hypothetical protein E1263_38375 [Kribbella antibiotica]